MQLNGYLFSREQLWHLFIRQRIKVVQNYPRNKHCLHPCLSEFPNIMHANVAVMLGGSGCEVKVITAVLPGKKKTRKAASRAALT